MPTNSLALLNSFAEAVEQVDVFGGSVIKAGDVIVMDNCSFHQGNFVELSLCNILQERDLCLMCQPPYHPCYNTCEQCFHFMETVLRQYMDLEHYHVQGPVTASLSRQFFKFCGYL